MVVVEAGHSTSFSMNVVQQSDESISVAEPFLMVFRSHTGSEMAKTIQLAITVDTKEGKTILT